jgi:hypothetical protein
MADASVEIPRCDVAGSRRTGRRGADDLTMRKGKGPMRFALPAKRTRLVVLATLIAVTAGDFAEAHERISAPTVERVARAIVRDYGIGGMALMVANSSECYSSAHTLKAAGECVLYDIAAHHIDEAYRRDQVVDPGPFSDYFSDDQFSRRGIAFISNYLGGSWSLWDFYIGDTPRVVEARIAQLMERREAR